MISQPLIRALRNSFARARNRVEQQRTIQGILGKHREDLHPGADPCGMEARWAGEAGLGEDPAALKKFEEEQWNALGISPPDRSMEYPSCERIEGGMVFWPDKFTPCCPYTTEDYGPMPRLADYRSGEFPLKEVLQARRQIIVDNQGDGHWACKGCDKLRLGLWPPRRWLFDWMVFAHFTSCNLRCKYCYTVTHPESRASIASTYHVIPLMQTLIENDLLSPDTMVSLSGGEPTLLPECQELISLLIPHVNGFYIYTNAVIRSEAIHEALKLNKVGYLVIGLDAGTREVYTDLKGVDHYDAAWRNAADYAATGGPVIAKIVLRRENARDAVPFVRKTHESGIRQIYYDIDWFGIESGDVPDELVHAAARIKRESERLGVRSTVWCSHRHYKGIIDRIAKAAKEIRE